MIGAAMKTRRGAVKARKDTRWRDQLRGTLFQRHFQGA